MYKGDKIEVVQSAYLEYKYFFRTKSIMVSSKNASNNNGLNCLPRHTYSSRAISDILRGVTTIQRLCINYTLEIVKLRKQ